MIKSLLESPISLFYAVLVHVGLIVMLIYSVDWQADEEAIAKVKVVQATIVDESTIAKQVAKLKKKEKKKLREEDKRLEKDRQQAEREKLKLQKEAKRQAEALQKQQRLLEIEKQRKRNERKAAKNQPPKVDKPKVNKPKQQKPKPKPKDNTAEKRRAKLKAEKQRLAKIKHDKQKRADERRKEEQDLMMQSIAQEEEDMRLAELAQEQAQLDDAKVVENMTRVQRISAMIKQRITENWRRSTVASQKKDLSCVISVRLLPTGEVINVEIIKSSGDDVFDKSVVNAVWKSSPFPLDIEDRDIFDQYRELEINFAPKV
ncbi:MAG: cell envelope integrity protein TolA [Thiohalomonadales bacterium]